MLKAAGSLMLSLIIIALLVDAAATPPLPLTSPCFRSLMEKLADNPGSELAAMATPANVSNPEFTANNDTITLTDHALDMSLFPAHVRTYGAWLYLDPSALTATPAYISGLVFLDQSIRGYPRACFAAAIYKDQLILPSA